MKKIMLLGMFLIAANSYGQTCQLPGDDVTYCPKSIFCSSSNINDCNFMAPLPGRDYSKFAIVGREGRPLGGNSAFFSRAYSDKNPGRITCLYTGVNGLNFTIISVIPLVPNARTPARGWLISIDGVVSPTPYNQCFGINGDALNCPVSSV